MVIRDFASRFKPLNLRDATVFGFVDARLPGSGLGLGTSRQGIIRAICGQVFVKIRWVVKMLSKLVLVPRF